MASQSQSRQPEYSLNTTLEPKPILALGGESFGARGREVVDTPPAPLALGPLAIEQAGTPKPMQRRVDSPVLKIHTAIARSPQGFGYRVPVPSPSLDRREQQHVQVALQALTAHTWQDYPWSSPSRSADHGRPFTTP